MAPDFWDDPKKAEKILAEISSKKKWTDGFNQTNNAVEDAVVMFEFFQSGDASEAELQDQFEISKTAVEELELKNMLRSKEDQLSAVLQITAGAGGTESCDWAYMLMRM
jgi:peptide chain release factor 2